MKRFMLRSLPLALLLTGALLATPSAQSLEADLQRVMQKEAVATDLKPVIEEYRKVVARAGSNRAVAARALLRIADCYQRIGDAESKKVLEQIVRDYADQREAAEARTRLGTTRAAATGAASGPSARQLWTGADAMGSPSGDGQLVSYTDWETGDLGIRDLVSNTSRRLTKTGGWAHSGDFAEFSVVSPDGRQVAYAWFNDKAEREHWYELRVLPTNASENTAPRLLSMVPRSRWIRPASWSADGRTLYVLRETAEDTSDLLLAVSLADGSVREVKKLSWTPAHVSPSPDGRYLAYDLPVRRGTSQRHVHILDARSGADQILDAATASDFAPLWTPDGTRIVFISDRTGATALWAASVANGVLQGRPSLISTELTTAPIGISRSGAIFYVKGGDRRNVFVANVDASGRAAGAPVLLTERSLNLNRSAAWSDDGEHVAFYSDRGLRGVERFATLVVRTLKTGDDREIPLRLHVPGGLGAVLRWFPDGRSVLVPSRAMAEADVPPGWYRVDVATGDAQRVLATPESVTDVTSLGAAEVMPDGASIVYTNGTSIIRRDLKTGADRELAKLGWVGAIAMAPDGGHVAYLGNDSGPKTFTNQIVVMPLGGGPRRVLFQADAWTNSTRFNTLAWTRDQKSILFVRGEKGTDALWRVPVAGGVAEATGLSVVGRLKAPQMHPDGRRLVYTVLETTAAELWALERFLPATPRKGHH